MSNNKTGLARVRILIIGNGRIGQFDSYDMISLLFQPGDGLQGILFEAPGHAQAFKAAHLINGRVWGCGRNAAENHFFDAGTVRHPKCGADVCRIFNTLQ